MPLPVYHFDGSITVKRGEEYIQDYLDFPFKVPPGTGALRLCLQYTPHQVGAISNLITLGLFDPHGFRGNAHRHPPDKRVILSSESATAGFIPGAIEAGDWLAQLAIQAVMADVKPCAYSLDIELLPAVETCHAAQPRQFALREQPASEHPGWLKGELHSHTIHSDGKLTSQELVAQALQNQFDFLAVTDHNTNSALGEIEITALNTLKNGYLGLLIIPGIELTTFHGHALALGVERWVDWRTGYRGWKMEDAARLTRAMGGVFIIAHPNDVGTPICTGCKWEYADIDLDLVDAIEIWNGRWAGSVDKNPKSLQAWQTMQEGPHRIPATCGADYHQTGEWGEGIPITYVYASELSAPAVLEGVRQGRVILSSGPWLRLQVSDGAESERAEVGDTLLTKTHQVCLTTAWEKAPLGAYLVARCKQGVIFNRPAAGDGSTQHWVEVQADDRLWIELYAGDGSLLAITNPVFIRVEPHPGVHLR